MANEKLIRRQTRNLLEALQELTGMDPHIGVDEFLKLRTVAKEEIRDGWADMASSGERPKVTESWTESGPSYESPMPAPKLDANKTVPSAKNFVDTGKITVSQEPEEIPEASYANEGDLDLASILGELPIHGWDD